MNNNAIISINEHGEWGITMSNVYGKITTPPHNMNELVKRISGTYRPTNTILFDSTGKSIEFEDILSRLRMEPLQLTHITFLNYLIGGHRENMFKSIKYKITNSFFDNDYVAEKVIQKILTNKMFYSRFIREIREDDTRRMVYFLKKWPYVGSITRDIAKFVSPPLEKNPDYKWFCKMLKGTS